MKVSCCCLNKSCFPLLYSCILQYTQKLQVLIQLRSLFVYFSTATTATPPVNESKLLYIQIIILVSIIM